MGELLDRGFQREILHVVANDYPSASDILATFGPQSNNSLKVNLAYLREHGLVEFNVHSNKDDQFPMPLQAVITAKGLDFLSDDGGLSAILGVVTVQFSEEQFRKLLLEKISAADGAAEDKSAIIQAIEEMPTNALNEVFSRAVDWGIEQAPEALGALQSALGL
ncbi:hypothetical protein [Pseudophaeobacter sp. EL27]|uniref:hypothetical protein n=1 Tax=Pseudophaeobacter sp. EL27 TaxID=2107580 RepID=UPI000EFCF7E6|nr:hypothetical protein [Pseudophaeobacter sp. EL27]